MAYPDPELISPCRDLTRAPASIGTRFDRNLAAKIGFTRWLQDADPGSGHRPSLRVVHCAAATDPTVERHDVRLLQVCEWGLLDYRRNVTGKLAGSC